MSFLEALKYAAKALTLDGATAVRNRLRKEIASCCSQQASSVDRCRPLPVSEENDAPAESWVDREGRVLYLRLPETQNKFGISWFVAVFPDKEECSGVSATLWPRSKSCIMRMTREPWAISFGQSSRSKNLSPKLSDALLDTIR